ncbi:MAG: RNA methyltransferase [Chlamydiales bacterium]|nr:RNA methyltransferase [Chlamydiales bacterium]
MKSEPADLSSLQNPKVKLAVRLRDRRDRDTTGLYLIEGYRELLRAHQGQTEVETLFICHELFLGTNEGKLIQNLRESGATVYTCTASVFQKLSYRDRPDGLLAIAKQHHRLLTDLQPSANPFLVVAEAIEKPGNLGTILRSSDAVGLDALLVCDRCTDIFNPNVVRASVGTLFSVPVIECTGADALDWLRENGIQILAATPQAKAVYTDVDLTGPVAIAVGTEQLGLSELWMDGADLQVSIPMRGMADSLNVATATTLLLYEVLRQRTLA